METMSDNRDDMVSRHRNDTINGPGFASLPAWKFAERRVKERRHTADDPSVRKREKNTQVLLENTMFS